MPTQKQKVLILDNVHEACAKTLAAEGFAVSQEGAMPPDKLETRLARYSAVVVRGATRVTSALLRAGAGGALRLVVRAGAGTDNISVHDATRLGIIVENTPGTNAQAVIEHTIGALICMARNIIPAHNSLKAGKWEKKAFEGAELHGRTLGIIGLGRIGRGVASVGRALGMRVLGFDPLVSKDKAQEFGSELTAPEKIFEQAEFLTLHAALTDQSRGILGEKAFARMKPGVCIVNCARAELVEAPALLKALDSGKVKYYFTDVFETEPPHDDPVVRHPRALVTPHLAGSTEESGIEGARMAAEQIAAYFKHDRIINAVNFAPGDPSLKPWEALAEKLGAFAYQYLADGGFRHVTVSYWGRIASLDTNRVTCSFYAGFMKNVSDAVNIVNAKAIAAERGIGMTEARGGGEADSMGVTLVCGDGAVLNLAGASILGKPILQKVDEYSFDIPLVENHFLVSVHSNVPGIVGIIGTVLGANKINIEKMGLQDIPGRPAMAVITTREAVPESAIQQIGAEVRKKGGKIKLRRIKL
jgi:D-3-phosphoglycerate dehydrogenase